MKNINVSWGWEENTKFDEICIASYLDYLVRDITVLSQGL